MNQDVIDAIYTSFIKDEKHPNYYESFQQTSSIGTKIMYLLQFLEIHLDLRRHVTYDNLEEVCTGILVKIHPEMSFDSLRTNVNLVCFFIRQDFLYSNLDRHKIKKNCFFF